MFPSIDLCPQLLKPGVSKATNIPSSLVFLAGRYVSTELSVLTKMFCVCAAQYGSHKPHIPIKHWKCG